MGILQWWQRRRAAIERDLARRRYQAAEAAFERAESAWNAEAVTLQRELEIASNPTALATSANVTVPIVVHKGEVVLLVAAGATLVEPKRLPGQWIGGYSGMSFRVMKGVRYHVGGTRGTYIQGAEVPQPIALGTVTITDRRVVFQSDKQAREWAFGKLLGYQHDPANPITYLQVSNRQKVSGVGYDAEHARVFQFRLGLGLAMFQEQVPDLVAQVQREIAEHDADKPTPPTPVRSLSTAGHDERSSSA